MRLATASEVRDYPGFGRMEKRRGGCPHEEVAPRSRLLGGELTMVTLLLPPPTLLFFINCLSVCVFSN